MTNYTVDEVSVIITYWVGTQQLTGRAKSYRGAMRIASRNQNAFGPYFHDEDGVELHDDGQGLAYEETDEDRRMGQRRYAVM